MRLPAALATTSLCSLVLLASCAHRPGQHSAAKAASRGGAVQVSGVFDDWQDDAPGRRQRLTLEQMPPVGADSENPSKVVALPAGASPRVPEGFVVDRIATGLAQPRAIRVAPNGDLFVSNSKANEVRVYRVSSDSPSPVDGAVFASGLNKPYGIAFYPPGDSPRWVYVANTDSIVRFPYTSGDLAAQAQPEVIVDKLPSTHHWTKDIVFARDGSRFYINVGSGSNIALDMFPEPKEDGGLEAWKANKPLGAAWDTEARRATILSYDPHGKDERTVVTGIRNAAGITIRPGTDELWAVVNERDGLGDNTPFEYATQVKQGQFYGWPWFYMGPNADKRLQKGRPDLREHVATPDVYLQAHSAPLQIAFYDAAQFPADYRGDAFVALHGSWDRKPRTGYKVVRLIFDDSGRPTGEYEDFMTGMVVNEQEVWGRPVGVAVGKDGSLFVSDDGSGSVWRVRYTGPTGRR